MHYANLVEFAEFALSIWNVLPNLWLVYTTISQNIIWKEYFYICMRKYVCYVKYKKIASEFVGISGTTIKDTIKVDNIARVLGKLKRFYFFIMVSIKLT